MRLFVALPLPERVTERLSDLAIGLPGARWVPPENMHLTLRFIGEVDGGEARDIDAALAEISVPRFDLTLAGLGSFGDGKHLRALWAGVESNPALNRLQAKVESAVVRAGQPAEPRKFKPHVSLARFKKNGATPPYGKMQDFLSAHGLFRMPPFTVDSFVLYSSFLSHEGAIYRAEAEYPLDHEIPVSQAAGRG